MGLKLIVVCALALLMMIPSLFVDWLVDDRTSHAAEAVHVSQNIGGPQTFLGVGVVNPYQSVDRSLKYLILFLGLVFLTYFVFEVTSGKRVHPAQYILVGVAQLIFYLLLLSLAEKIGFDWGYLIAGVATVTLLSLNAGWIFESQLQTARSFAVFALLYVLIYLLLRLENDALLLGSIASFLAVAAAMYFTRKIDWYGSLAGNRAPELPPAPPDAAV